jgi:hypothetical protein
MPGEKRSKQNRSPQSSDEDKEEEIKPKRPRKSNHQGEITKSDDHVGDSGDDVGVGKDSRESEKIPKQIPTGEGELVCWLASSSVPLAEKIKAASQAMKFSTEERMCTSEQPVSGRLAASVSWVRNALGTYARD